MQDRMDDRAYAGRASLRMARISEQKIVDASFNGVEIRPVNQDSLHPEYSNDQLWARKLATITNEFGKEGKDRILATQDFVGHRAVLYKFNAADRVAPETLVNFDIWTEMSGKTLEVSISAGYGERSTIEQQARRVLDALTPPNGNVDGSILVVPDAFLHLPPDLGESVNAFFRFGAGYELTLKTDVLRHAQLGKDIAELVQAPVPEGFSRRVLETGNVNAGPLRGTEAVIALHSRKDESDSFIAVYHFPGVEGGKPLFPTVDLELKGGSTKDPSGAQSFVEAWHAVLRGFTIRTR